MISGKIVPDQDSLVSAFNKDVSGVLRTIKIVEYFTKLRGKKWHEDSQVLHYEQNFVPFSIVSNTNNQSPFQIKIVNPLKTKYLFENLELTFEKYDKNNRSFTQVLLDNIFTTKIIRGVKTTEKMFITNTSVIAFGKLNKTNKKIASTGLLETEFYELSEPEDVEFPFILTPLSRLELIKQIKSKTRSTRYFVLLFAVIGIVIGSRFIYRNR